MFFLSINLDPLIPYLSHLFSFQTLNFGGKFYQRAAHIMDINRVLIYIIYGKLFHFNPVISCEYDIQVFIIIVRLYM